MVKKIIALNLKGVDGAIYKVTFTDDSSGEQYREAATAIYALIYHKKIDREIIKNLVSGESSQKQFKSAKRKLILALHPDTTKATKQETKDKLAEAFKLINPFLEKIEHFYQANTLINLSTNEAGLFKSCLIVADVKGIDSKLGSKFGKKSLNPFHALPSTQEHEQEDNVISQINDHHLQTLSALRTEYMRKRDFFEKQLQSNLGNSETISKIMVSLHDLSTKEREAIQQEHERYAIELNQTLSSLEKANPSQEPRMHGSKSNSPRPSFS